MCCIYYLNILSCKIKHVMYRGTQIRPTPIRPDQTTRSSLDFSPKAPNRCSRRLEMGFHTQDPMLAGWVAGFLLQNPSHPTRPMLYTNPANFGKIKLKFEEIRWDLDHIWWDLASFGQILANFGDFGANFDDFSVDLVSFCRFRWLLLLLLLFIYLFIYFQISVIFSGFDDSLHRPYWPVHHPNLKPTRLIDANGWFRVPPPST